MLSARASYQDTPSLRTYNTRKQYTLYMYTIRRYALILAAVLLSKLFTMNLQLYRREITQAGLQQLLYTVTVTRSGSHYTQACIVWHLRLVWPGLRYSLNLTHEPGNLDLTRSFNKSLFTTEKPQCITAYGNIIYDKQHVGKYLQVCITKKLRKLKVVIHFCTWKMQLLQSNFKTMLVRSNKWTTKLWVHDRNSH